MLAVLKNEKVQRILMVIFFMVYGTFSLWVTAYREVMLNIQDIWLYLWAASTTLMVAAMLGISIHLWKNAQQRKGDAE